MKYPNIYIPNRGAAHYYSSLAEDSDEIIRLNNAVEEYNDYLDQLERIDGFRQFFIEHSLCVSKEEIAKHWSEEIAELVFSKRSYVFSTDLRLLKEVLFDKTYAISYSVNICGEKLFLPVGESADRYPEKAGNKRVIWNWVDNGHDFCYYLWELLGSPYRENEVMEDDEDAVSYVLDWYDEIRDNTPEPQLVRIFQKLEDLGYLETYTIIPEKPNPLWAYFGKSDGSFDCAIIDMSFLKNKLVREQINLILWSSPEELKAKPYILTDENNNQVLSSIPGSFGGHKKLKIFGRLDCPSANSHLGKGQYAKNRVFFLDEKSAIEAGYRPCAVCMTKEYRKWKADQAEAKFQQEYWAGYEQGFYQ